MSAGSSIVEGGFIGLTRESVGIDRRIYTGRTDTNPTLPVSYNAGRVEVYLNGIRLVGNHTEMGSTYDYTFTGTGSGSSIQLQTGIQLTSSDVIECIGYVSNSANTVTTYNPTVSAGDNTFTGINHSSSDLLNVYLNGVLLDSSDYTASPGTASTNPNTVAITALALNDVVAIQVIQALAHNDFVPAGGGTFSGNVAYTGNIQVDDIVEKTSAHGVEIDGVTLKDGGGTFTGNVTHNGNFQTLNDSGTAYGYIGKGDQLVSSANSDDLGLRYTNNLYISEGTTKRLSVASGGDVTVNTGNLVIGTAGKGIDFSASSATDGIPNGGEVLEHVERGTFTPYVANSDGTNKSTVSETVYGNGRYSKIGNVCHVWFNFRVGVNSVTDRLFVKLPITADNNQIGTTGTEGFAYPMANTANNVHTGSVASANTVCSFESGSGTALTCANMSDSYLYVYACYQTAD